MPVQAREVGAARAACPFEVGSQAQLSRGKVNYRLEGPADASAPLVVCLHGLNASLASFATLGAALRERGLRTLTYDLYGFGLSASPSGRLCPSLYVEQLRELLDFIEPSPGGDPKAVCLLGYCLGGLVATDFALRHPGRVARLLLVAPCGFAPRAEAPCPSLIFGCLRRRCCGDIFVALASCLAWCCVFPIRKYLNGKTPGFCSPDVRDPDSERFKAYARKNTERAAWGMPRTVTSCLRGLRDMPIWREDFAGNYERLAKEGQVEVLFIWGDDDGVVPLEEADDMLHEIFGPTGASCIRISGGGHGIILEDEDVAQVSSCAAAWFMRSKDPNWLRCLQSHALQAPSSSALSTTTATGGDGATPNSEGLSPGAGASQV